MPMHTIRCLLITPLFLFVFHGVCAQDTFIEIGAGIGNIVGNKNARGKAELHFSVIKPYSFGELGLGFYLGGNFIPGTSNTVNNNIEILSSNDFKFTAITILYRLPINKYLFVESNLGYSSLFSFVHTDKRVKINQPNFTAGINVGGHINNFILSLRYQYLGVTPNYNGTRTTTIVKSNSKPLTVFLLRLSYRFNLNDLF